MPSREPPLIVALPETDFSVVGAWYPILPPTTIHDQHGSPAGLLIDEAKSIRDNILDTLERCHTTFRLFMSSTGQAAGGFYRIITAKAHMAPSGSLMRVIR